MFILIIVYISEYIYLKYFGILYTDSLNNYFKPL